MDHVSANTDVRRIHLCLQFSPESRGDGVELLDSCINNRLASCDSLLLIKQNSQCRDVSQLYVSVHQSAASGNDGIIRGAMRSFTNRRTVSKLALDAPYQLVRWDNGEVALYDALTDTSVPIDAFGPYAPGATLDLINLMKKPAAD